MLGGMDREILLRYLVEVENRAALGELQIAEQRTRIEQLERDGRGVRETKVLLASVSMLSSGTA
jgi:hypothetical protein